MKVICKNCIYIPSIKIFVIEHYASHISNCSYCENIGLCIGVNFLNKRISEIIDYAALDIEDLDSIDKSSVYFGSEHVHIMVYDTAIESICFDKELANYKYINENEREIKKPLIERAFDSKEGGFFCINYGEEMYRNKFYEELKKSIKKANENQRFFNKDVERIFKKLTQIKSNKDIHESCLKTIRKGENIYRARCYGSMIMNELTDRKIMMEILKNPEVQLSSPPSNLSQNNRMTPSGISAFYGALNIDTCISEIKPAAGQAIISAVFKSYRDIKLINLEDLHKNIKFEGKILDETELDKYHVEYALGYLINLISQPYSNTDKEYLTTQLFFSYLQDKLQEKIDGIIFKSSQSIDEEYCITLFPGKEKILEIDKKSLKSHIIKETKFNYLTRDIEDLDMELVVLDNLELFNINNENSSSRNNTNT